MTRSLDAPLNTRQAVALSLGAVASFHLAYAFPALSFLIAAFIACLVPLSRLASRRAFYFGLTIGVLIYAPHLSFFVSIFQWLGAVLWLVVAVWVGFFLVLARLCRIHCGPVWAAILIPFLWTGLEYFRSELWYLRFSWLNAGFVFSENLRGLPMAFLGVYGIGFFLMAVASGLELLPLKKRIVVGALVLIGLGILANWPMPNHSASPGQPVNLRIAGFQIEGPAEKNVPQMLDQLIKKFPDAELLVLSEYTFSGPIPEAVKTWCQKNRRYLIAGGQDPVGDKQYYNTAFVVGPEGEVVFKQVKAVPIQFFTDGLPAKEQEVWNSPWGKIGFCICYDLSYSRVTDRLIRQGAQALVVPTMDVAEWGSYQHRLHARVTPVRAAEYGVPIFRLASSGISQSVDRNGTVQAKTSFPGQGTMLRGELNLQERGSLPLDRIIAPCSVAVTAGLIAWLVVIQVKRRRARSHSSIPPAENKTPLIQNVEKP